MGPPPLLHQPQLATLVSCGICYATLYSTRSTPFSVHAKSLFCFRSTPIKGVMGSLRSSSPNCVEWSLFSAKKFVTCAHPMSVLVRLLGFKWNDEALA